MDEDDEFLADLPDKIDVKPKENIANLQQRLRSVNTEEDVDIVIGTPEDALGSGTIRSLIPSRKAAAARLSNDDVTSTVTSLTNVGSSVVQKPYYNPRITEEIEVDIIEPIIQSTGREKALYRGRYFPSFGLFCAPLMGTQILPLSPKMEKSMDRPVDGQCISLVQRHF